MTGQRWIDGERPAHLIAGVGFHRKTYYSKAVGGVGKPPWAD